MKPTSTYPAKHLMPAPRRTLWRKRRAWGTCVCATAWLGACALFTSNDEFGLFWSGKPLAQLTQTWGKPAEQQTQVDGSTVVRYEWSRAACTYWFTADASGKIASYRYEVGQWGSCKPM